MNAINSLLLATAIANATIYVAGATDNSYWPPTEAEVRHELRQRQQAIKNWPVPLPEHTPFDRDPLQRAEYIGGFRSGYRSALTGVLASFWPNPKTSESRCKGLVAGQNKALTDHPDVLSGHPPIRRSK